MTTPTPIVTWMITLGNVLLIHLTSGYASLANRLRDGDETLFNLFRKSQTKSDIRTLIIITLS